MTDDPMPALARRCWGTLETLHVVGYFAPEPAAAYRELGLRGWAGYFASRSAAMGAVAPGVTVATFYVFAPDKVAAALPAAWATADPSAVLAARHAGVAAALHRVLGTPDVAEALDLARAACAGLRPQGRALYAGHAALPEPADRLLALWHAATLLREHRGDGHVAALLLAGLDPVEALVTAGLVNGQTPFLKATRGWTGEEWAAAEERLRGRGLLAADGSLTDDGTALRAELEARTDATAEVGWRGLGQQGCERLLELVRPLRRELVASDIFPAGLFASR
jgi:hypothetical protein